MFSCPRDFAWFSQLSFYWNRKYLYATFWKELQQKKINRKGAKRDLLDLFLDTKDEETGKLMEDDDIISQCVTIFLAGHDTTGTEAGIKVRLF